MVCSGRSGRGGGGSAHEARWLRGRSRRRWSRTRRRSESGSRPVSWSCSCVAPRGLRVKGSGAAASWCLAGGTTWPRSRWWMCRWRSGGSRPQPGWTPVGPRTQQPPAARAGMASTPGSDGSTAVARHRPQGGCTHGRPAAPLLQRKRGRQSGGAPARRRRCGRCRGGAPAASLSPAPPAASPRCSCAAPADPATPPHPAWDARQGDTCPAPDTAAACNAPLQTPQSALLAEPKGGCDAHSAGLFPLFSGMHPDSLLHSEEPLNATSVG